MNLVFLPYPSLGFSGRGKNYDSCLQRCLFLGYSTGDNLTEMEKYRVAFLVCAVTQLGGDLFITFC